MVWGLRKEERKKKTIDYQIDFLILEQKSKSSLKSFQNAVILFHAQYHDKNINQHPHQHHALACEHLITWAFPAGVLSIHNVQFLCNQSNWSHRTHRHLAPPLTPAGFIWSDKIRRKAPQSRGFVLNRASRRSDETLCGLTWKGNCCLSFSAPPCSAD